MKKLSWNFHPFIFVLIAVLFIYLIGIWSFPPTQMARSLITLWIVLLILRPIANWTTGDKNWGGILITILVFCLFFQEALFKIFGAIIAGIIAIIAIYLFLIKKKLTASILSKTITVIGIVILIAQIASLMWKLAAIPISYFASMAERTTNPSIVELSAQNGIKPDIYFIILDSYPREDVLKEFFQYDNSDFTEYLEETGFIVAQNAHSNYPRTSLSVSSTLDMEYWQDISPETQGLNFWWLAKPVISHSRVRMSLEAIGYQSVSIASNWGITNNESTDSYFKPYPVILNDFENFFILSTPIRLFYAPFQRIAPISSADTHRRYILFNLDTLEQLHDIQGPKFVVSHIIAPHPPFVLEADGTPIQSTETFTFESSPNMSIAEQQQGYINEIKFLNKRLRGLIETILNNSKTPPIIILQADHGSNLYVDLNAVENTCLKERYAIFGAYHLPGKSKETIPQNITPINLFRIIFNEYFGAELPLLENRIYFTDKNRIFNLIEITDQVDKACKIPKN